MASGEEKSIMKIGVTGHQELENSEWVQQQLTLIICSQALPLVGITSLAVGADQLFAQAVLKCGGSLRIIVPTEDYWRKFDADGLKEYQRLLMLASTIDVLPNGPSEENSYFDAGKLVVRLSDLLIAVWDGKPAVGLGGTGDVVEYAKSYGRRLFHINPMTKEVTL